jgi:hypothetical protein
VLSALREEHGSIETYLLDRAAVTPEVIVALRDRLIE